jgi:hypothetical protein
MSLMTPCAVRQDGASAIVLSGGFLGARSSVRIGIHAEAAPAIRSEEIAITDARLLGSWGSRLCRTVLAWPNVPAAGEVKLEITAA